MLSRCGAGFYQPIDIYCTYLKSLIDLVIVYCAIRLSFVNRLWGLLIFCVIITSENSEVCHC